MNKLERQLARATFDAIKDKAQRLGTFDKMVLAGALNRNDTFDAIPGDLQTQFLSIAMEVVKVLQAAGQRGG